MNHSKTIKTHSFCSQISLNLLSPSITQITLFHPFMLSSISYLFFIYNTLLYYIVIVISSYLKCIQIRHQYLLTYFLLSYTYLFIIYIIIILILYCPNSLYSYHFFFYLLLLFILFIIGLILFIIGLILFIIGFILFFLNYIDFLIIIKNNF